MEKERKKAAQEEKRKAKQAQIAAGKELANKLFLVRTPHSPNETSESEDEDPLQKAKKRTRSAEGSIKRRKGEKNMSYTVWRKIILLLALSL